MSKIFALFPTDLIAACKTHGKQHLGNVIEKTGLPFQYLDLQSAHSA
jgi:hypothetical protein